MAENLSSSEILPWKIILQHQIKKRIKFDDLPQYLPDKTHDKTAKFINLLYLESEGYIKICQDEPFGQVSIQPNEIDAEPEGLLIIKDRGGSEYGFDWKDLSDAQRGIRMDYNDASPSDLAQKILEIIHAPTNFLPVNVDGAQKAANMIIDLVKSGK